MKRELTLLVNDVEYVVTVSRQDDTLIVEHGGERYEVVVRENRVSAPRAAAAGSGPSASARPAAPRPVSPASAPATGATKGPAADAARDGAVPAPMVGVVREVHVSVGADVREGDPVVTMEAMKMEIYVTAPCAGRVRAVHCAVGDTTADGTVLAEITPAGAGAL